MDSNVLDYYLLLYIEMVKPRLYNKEDKSRDGALWTLQSVLINSLKLLHPFMPFITEEIFMHLQEKEETIMLSSWCVYSEDMNFEKEEKDVELIKSAVKNIRNIRSEMNVPPSRKAKVIIVSTDENVRNTFMQNQVFFSTLSYANEVIVQDNSDNVGSDSVSVVISNATIYMPFNELVDIEKEKLRLGKEYEKYKREVERVEKKLSNQGFISKAPSDIIEEEKAKQDKYKNMLEQIKQQLENLN